MHPATADGRHAAKRFGPLDRIAILSRSWVFAMLSALLAIGAVVSCESAPQSVRVARD